MNEIFQLHNQTPQRLSGVHYWFSCHLRAFLFALGELFRYPIGNLVTLFVIGIAFSLPVILFELLQNGETAMTYFHESPTIMLYLKQDMSSDQLNSLLQTLQQNRQIQATHYISPQEGLNALQADSSISAAIQALGSNPLPGVIEVTPNQLNNDPAMMQSLYDQLKTNSYVDSAQLNMAWVKRLFYLIQTLKQLTLGIAFIFCIGLVLIVGNTIRLDMKSHQEEIYILRLIGATNAFIRRPLLYKGLLYGLIGSVIALLLANSVLWWLESPLSELTLTYNAVFHLQGLSVQQILIFILSCAFLSYLGGRMVANYFLRREHVIG